MRLLFDQNLSRRLVGTLAVEFPDSCHVAELGLDTATDRTIWEHAGEHGLVIISKDSDFRQLAFMLGPPPKAIWLNLGNASTDEIATVIRDHLSDILDFGEAEQDALLVLPALLHESGPVNDRRRGAEGRDIGER